MDAPDEDTPPVTSTPAASPNRPSDLLEEDLANDSMPSLESVTDHEVDSGNSSSEELVIKNFEREIFKLYLQNFHPYTFRPKSRTRDHHPDPQSELWGRFYNDHKLVESIIITDFITYLLHLFINYYYLYSQTNESIVFLSTPIDINME